MLVDCLEYLSIPKHLQDITSVPARLGLESFPKGMSPRKINGFSIEEPLFFQCFEQSGGHGLVVFLRIADVGEDLGEGLLVVDLAEMAVLLELLLAMIIGVDGSGGVLVVGLLVEEAVEGQTVGEGRLFGWPAYGEGGYGHDEARKLEGVDDHLGHVDGRAEIAIAQSFLVHEVAERLRVEQGVDGSILVGEEVVVAWLRLTLLTPAGGAVEVGTDGEHDGCLGDHRLVEVGRSQSRLHLVGTGDDDAVELQVAHGLCTCCLGHQSVQQFFTHFLVAIFANGATV